MPIDRFVPARCPFNGRWLILLAAKRFLLAAILFAVWLRASAVSAQLLDPVPFWKTDFSTNPTRAGADPNGDGQPDWFIRGGETFTAGAGNLGILTTDQSRTVWRHAVTDSIGSTGGAVLDSAPASTIAAGGAVMGSRIIARTNFFSGSTNTNISGHTQNGLLVLQNWDPNGIGQWASYGMVLSNYSGGQQIQWFNAANGVDVSSGGRATSLPGNDYLRIDSLFNTTTHTVSWSVYDDSQNDQLLFSGSFATVNNVQSQTADAKTSLLDNSYSTHGVGDFNVGHAERSNQTFVWNSLVNTSAWNNTTSGGWNSASYSAPSTNAYPNSAGSTALMSQSLTFVPAALIVLTTSDAKVGTLTLNNTNIGNSLGWTIASGSGTNALTFDCQTGVVSSGSAVLNFGLIGGSSTQQNTISAPVILNSNLNINVLTGTTGTISGPISSGTSGTGITLSSGGTLVLSAANSYSGLTRISSGTLRTGAVGAIPAGSPVVVNDTFDLGGFTQSVASLAGGGIVTNSGTRTLLIIGGDGAATSYSGTIQNGNGLIDLTKIGSITQTLTGPQSNTYTGSTIVSGGSLVLDFSSLSGTAPTNLINGNSSLAIGGGTFAVVGKAGSGKTSSQSLIGTTILAGASSITVNVNGGDGTTLNLAGLTRMAAGGTIDFTLPNGMGTMTTTTANANNILGGYATVGGKGWASNDGLGNIASLIAYGTNYATASALTNFDAKASGTFGATAVNSLRFNTPATMTANLASNSLAITSGGILITPAVGNNVTLLRGSATTVQALTSGNSAGDLIVIQNNTSKPFSLQDVQLGASGSNNTGLTKSGAGTLIYYTANPGISNQGTGPVIINAGTLQLSLAAGAIGQGPIVVGQRYAAPTLTATLQMTNAANPAMIDPANSSVTIYRTGTLNLAGVSAMIQNNAGLSVFGDATAQGQVLTGSGTLIARNLSYTGGGAVVTSVGKLIIDDGGSGGSVAYNAGNNGVGAAITGNLGLDNANNGVTTFNVADDPNLAAELTISAIIVNQAGANRLTKSGAGHLALSGPNTFSGNVTITAGTLAASAVSTAGIAQPLGTATTAINAGSSSGCALAYNGVFSGFAPALSRPIAIGGAGGATIVSATAGQSVAITGGVNGGGNPGIFDGPGNVVLSANPVSGNGTTLTKNGAGTLSIDPGVVNSYTGGTIVNSGVLKVSNAGNFGVAGSPLTFNGGTLQFAASFDAIVGRIVTLNSGGATIDTQAANVTFASALGNGGNGGLTKIGSGMLTLSSSAPNTYTGPTAINSGTLKLDFSNMSTPTNLVDASSQLTLAGGMLSIGGNPAAAASQTFSGLTITPGAAIVGVNSSGANSTTLALGPIVAHDGGIIDFTLPASGSITTTSPIASFLAAGTGPGIVGGQATILGGWATVGGANWAVSGSSGGGAGNVTPLNSYANSWSANADVSDPGGASGNIAVNSLRFNGQSSSAQSDSLVIATGGILLAPGMSGDVSLNQHSGLLTTTQGQGADYAPDLNVIANQSSGVFHLNSVISGNQNLNIARTTAGTAVVALGGGSPNMYQGTTRVLASVLGQVELDLSSSGAAIPGPLVIGGGSNASAGAATVKLLNANQQTAANMPITINSDGRLDFNNQPVANCQLGPLTMTSGSIVNSGNGSDTATVVLDGDVTASSSGGVPASIDLGSNPNSGVLWNNAAGGGNRNFTVNSGGPTATSDLTIGAIIRDGSPSASLTKLGSGVLTLASPTGNLYSGGTAINAGTLLISNTSGSAAGSALVAVQTGATLGGGGMISGMVQTISSGAGPANNGHLAPGAGGSPATLHLNGGLMLGNNSYLDFRLSNSTAGGNDQIAAATSVALGSGGTLDINAYNGSLAVGTYKLITLASGTIANPANAASWSIGSNNDVLGHTYSFSSAIPGEFDLIVGGAVGSIVWTGHSAGTGATNDIWDMTQMNWAAGASPAIFTNGAAVTFGDANPIAGGQAPDGAVIIQSGGVAPMSVAFNNSAVNYTVSNKSGAIGITGSASLTKSGTGSVTLAGVNTYTGGTTITGGTLATTPGGSIGDASGGLAVSAAAGITSMLNLGNNQTVSRLSGTVAPTGSATVYIAGGASLAVNQTTTTTFAGALANSGAFTKSGAGTLELTAAPTFGDHSALSVNGGVLRLNVTSGSATIGAGVTATVAPGATLELAGSVSALASATNRVNVTNSSQAPAGGLFVSGTHQQVGNIDGNGNIVVAAGSDLTASHILQNALIIGGTAASPAEVVISASNVGGGASLIGADSTLTNAFSSTVSTGGPLPIESNFAPVGLGSAPFGITAFTDPSETARGAAVPEPSSLVLLSLGLTAAAIFASRRDELRFGGRNRLIRSQRRRHDRRSPSPLAPG